LDPAAASLPGEIESALGDGDSPSACVVILVDSEIDPDWGAQASLAVARSWAASGHRVILADGCLDGPVLHEAVGVENGEGVSDMVLYGASAQRFAGRIEDRLMLAPAGTPVVEVADVLKHVRWDMMISGCREVGATLVCHVSTGTPGVEAMTKRAEGVLVLASASKDVDTILGSTSGPLIAILGPDNGDAPPVASVDEEDDDAVAVEVLPGLPEEDEEVTVSVEAAPGPPEDGLAPTLTVDDLPELPESADEDGGAPDAFSLSGLEGEQYQAEESAGVGAEPTDLDSAADLEVASPVYEDVPLAADVPLAIDVPLEGFDAGAGVDFGDALDDLQGLSDLESPEETEFASTVASDGIDFATHDLLIVDPVAGPAPGLGAPLPFSGALSDLVVEEPPEGVDVAEATPERRRKYRGLARLERRRKREVFIRYALTGLGTILIVGGGGAAVAYYGFVNIPGITPPERVRSYVPAPVALPGEVPQSAIMSHVLFIDSWRTIETPITTADALRTRLPNLLFFVTPLEVAGDLQFALYVGPAYSAVEADALKESVAVVLDRLDPNDWSVRDAQYAFYFGEYDTPANSEGRILALAAASIPAYSLQVAYADGTTAVRVYGGAFVDEFEAAEMGRMINRADIGGMVLTSRRGIVPE